jgi:hypothetical protein
MLQQTSAEPSASGKQKWLSSNVQWGGDGPAGESHNVHENVGKYQEGGTAMMNYGNLLQQFDPEGSGRDDLGLGRWTYMRFVGDDRIVTRIICGYSPCANKKKDSGMVY